MAGELVFVTEGDQRFVDLRATVEAVGEDRRLNIGLTLLQAYSYGDNPHQDGIRLDLAGADSPLGFQHFKQVEGKDLSKSNYWDLSRGRKALTRSAANFDVNQGSVPLIALAMKHGNAAGGAFGDDPAQATKMAIMGSNEDSFGATFMTTFPIDTDIADIMVNYEKDDAPRRIMDVVAAPAISLGAIEMLRRTRGNMRILVNPALAQLSRSSLLKGIEIQGDGDIVSIQTPNLFTLDPTNPDQLMMLWDDPYPADEPIAADVLFAEGICSSSSSNTTTLVRDGMIIGNGVGQQARHRVTELAIHRALVNGHDTQGAAFSTDSFFLKSDGPGMLVTAGVRQGFGLRRDTQQPGSDVVTTFHDGDTVFINVPNSIGRGFTH